MIAYPRFWALSIHRGHRDHHPTTGYGQAVTGAHGPLLGERLGIRVTEGE